MDASSAKFVTSPSIQVVDQRGNAYIVSDLLTDRRFEVSSLVVQILDDLKTPMTQSQVGAKYCIAPATQLQALFSFLEHNELVHASDSSAVYDTCKLRPVHPRLFHLPQSTAVSSLPRLVLIGIPFGRGNAHSNASAFAPDSLRHLARELKVDFRSVPVTKYLASMLDIDTDFKHLDRHLANNRIVDAGNLVIHDDEPNQHVFTNIEKLSGRILDNGDVPLFLGGDHSVTYPILRAFNKRVKDLHVLHLDAHTDTYESQTDQLYAGINTHNHANFASKSMELQNVAAFHQFGIRGLCNVGDLDLNPKQHLFFKADIKKLLHGGQNLELPRAVPYYLTIDIDVVDPVIAPGTGNPVPRGLGYRQLFHLLDYLTNQRKIVGIDLVEIDIKKDMSKQTVELALRLLIALMAWFCRSTQGSDLERVFR
jgi:agmatinase